MRLRRSIPGAQAESLDEGSGPGLAVAKVTLKWLFTLKKPRQPGSRPPENPANPVRRLKQSYIQEPPEPCQKNETRVKQQGWLLYFLVLLHDRGRGGTVPFRPPGQPRNQRRGAAVPPLDAPGEPCAFACFFVATFQDSSHAPGKMKPAARFSSLSLLARAGVAAGNLGAEIQVPQPGRADGRGHAVGKLSLNMEKMDDEN